MEIEAPAQQNPTQQQNGCCSQCENCKKLQQQALEAKEPISALLQVFPTSLSCLAPKRPVVVNVGKKKKQQHHSSLGPALPSKEEKKEPIVIPPQTTSEKTTIQVPDKVSNVVEDEEITRMKRRHSKFQQKLELFDKLLIYSYTWLSGQSMDDITNEEMLIQVVNMLQTKISSSGVKASVTGFDSFWTKFFAADVPINFESQGLAPEEQTLKLSLFKLQLIERLNQLMFTLIPLETALIFHKITKTTDLNVKFTDDFLALPMLGGNELVGSLPFVSFDYARCGNNSINGPNTVVFEVCAPAGTMCLFIDPSFSAFPDRNEVLFPFGSVFKFSTVTQDQVNYHKQPLSTKTVNPESTFSPKFELEQPSPDAIPQIGSFKTKKFVGRVVQPKVAENLSDFEGIPAFWSLTKDQLREVIVKNYLNWEKFEITAKRAPSKFDILKAIPDNVDKQQFANGKLSDALLYRLLFFSPLFWSTNIEYGRNEDFDNSEFYSQDELQEYVYQVMKPANPFCVHLEKQKILESDSVELAQLKTEKTKKKRVSISEESDSDSDKRKTKSTPKKKELAISSDEESDSDKKKSPKKRKH